MAFNIGSESDDELLGHINTTPLVDVMLVLLIIFLITIPVVTTSVPIELPNQVNQVRETRADTVVVSVDADGKLFLYDTPVMDAAELERRLKPLARQEPQPEVQIRGDGRSDFEPIDQVMTALRRAGIAKVGFVTDPNH
jgi:biopolymer transport protein ExbD